MVTIVDHITTRHARGDFLCVSSCNPYKEGNTEVNPIIKYTIILYTGLPMNSVDDPSHVSNDTTHLSLGEDISITCILRIEGERKWNNRVRQCKRLNS